MPQDLDECVIFLYCIIATGHFICCQSCADQWRNQGIGQRRCPACNQTFFGPDAVQNAAAHVMTMQNHD